MPKVLQTLPALIEPANKCIFQLTKSNQNYEIKFMCGNAIHMDGHGHTIFDNKISHFPTS
ncbi:hypothetical protein SRABI27_05138 [Pedobacter sp. Bi27]|uniref:Uncharacterized protein n=1 Tax=Pedobacter ginsenosidimutans TaxID=687842 RepID=A0A0T5VIG2_9SPHI|nr:hypothetical protein ASU31_24795 [Pedobacter ginsenosidimutans]CAH0318507.1 hypothetical protein SRABI27_05138 [Pedobacter sp. Bi27]